MNLKSYLRGIGAGLMVACLIIYAASCKSDRKNAETVDKEVLLEHEEGLSVDEIAESVSLDTEESVEENITESEGEKEQEETGDETVSISDETEEGEETAEAAESEDNPDEAKDVTPEIIEITPIDPLPEGEPGYVESEKSVSIQVVRGDSSVSVSRRLYEAGLVESAVEFDEFLCKNNYDKRISVGTYEIPYNSDFETIANIIAR